MKTIGKFCESFWKLENEYGLLNLEIKGVKVWQAIRMQIYYLLAEKKGILQVPHKQKSSLNGYFKKILSYINGVIFFNPFFSKKRIVDEIIIDHPRSKLVNDKFIDIYTHYYLSELDNNGLNYLVLDRPFIDSLHWKSNLKNRKYLDVFIALSIIKIKLFSVKLNENDISIISSIESALMESFDVEIDLLGIIASAITKYKSNYRLYRLLFIKFKPKRLRLVVSYAYADAIRAAKDLGIETVEMQHGTFSKYHLGYSFPGRVEGLDYFPDKFMAWGDYWKKLNVIPLSEKNIVISGFTHFNNLRENYKKVVRKPSQILILSQGALGSKIADKILGQIESLDGYSIVYKLHPGEYSRWEEYKSLVKLSGYPNVSIVKDEDIYRLFAESAFQVGVFSTALYEGLGFDCRTILLDLPGVEYMRDLIEGGVVDMLQENESILNAINNYSQKEREYHYCYADIFGDTSQAVLIR